MSCDGNIQKEPIQVLARKIASSKDFPGRENLENSKTHKGTLGTLGCAFK